MARPPQRRVRWQLVLGPACGGHELALTSAVGRKLTFRLTEPSEIGFTMNGRHPHASAIEELATDVHVLWTSETGQTRILDRHRIGNTQDDLSADGHTVTVAGLDYKAVLARRHLLTGDSLIYTAVDQAEIAWQLIDTTQAKAGGQLGIAKSWTGSTPTGITRDRTFQAGDSIGERVAELAETRDGFDWDIVPTSASALQLQVWYPQRGTDRGVVLIHGGNLVASLRRDVDSGSYANAIRYTGNDTVSPEERTAPDLGDIAAVPQGRWEAVFGDTGLVTQNVLADRAAWQISQSQVITPAWAVTLRRGAWQGPDHIWLGDPVRLIINSGRLNVDYSYRVYEISIDLDGQGTHGGESVTLALGGPPPDFRRRTRLVDRRLKNLERR